MAKLALIVAIQTHTDRLEQAHAALVELRELVGPFLTFDGYKPADIDSVSILSDAQGGDVEIGIDYVWPDGEKDYRTVTVPMSVYVSDTAIIDWENYRRTLLRTAAAEADEKKRKAELAELDRLQKKYADKG